MQLDVSYRIIFTTTWNLIIGYQQLIMRLFRFVYYDNTIGNILVDHMFSAQQNVLNIKTKFSMSVHGIKLRQNDSMLHTGYVATIPRTKTAYCFLYNNESMDDLNSISYELPDVPSILSELRQNNLNKSFTYLYHNLQYILPPAWVVQL